MGHLLPEAVWLEQMWLAIELRTGRAVSHAPYVEALRQAAAHRLPASAALAGYGHTVVASFPDADGEARLPPARRILVTYTCISAATTHGDPITYRVHYTDGTGRLQWIRLRRDPITQAWLPANVHFVVSPQGSRHPHLGPP